MLFMTNVKIYLQKDQNEMLNLVSSQRQVEFLHCSCQQLQTI